MAEPSPRCLPRVPRPPLAALSPHAPTTCKGQEPSMPFLIPKFLSAIASERSYFPVLTQLTPFCLSELIWCHLSRKLSRLPLSKVWCLFSGFPQPVGMGPLSQRTCHSVLSCSRSWVISYSILELQSLVERLCKAGIKSTVLVGWTNDWGERTEAKGLFQNILWSQRYPSSSPNLISYQLDQLNFSSVFFLFPHLNFYKLQSPL